MDIISQQDEIEELASELAEGYIDYFTIDTREQQQKTADSLEECLTHLEEVCSVLDSYRQHSDKVSDVVEKISSKSETLLKLYEQVDALEQFLFETNRRLDQLDTELKELEKNKSFGSHRLKQMIGYLNRIGERGRQLM